MRSLLKKSASALLIPLVRWYLRKERKYSYEGISVTVSPGVFHPGLFSSTLFLLKFLRDKPLQAAEFLELGCGTGLISIVAAKANGKVTACDLSMAAIENAKKNFVHNKVDVQLIHSDLFDALGRKAFDWIVINPPYYARAIERESDLAWNCGEHFQYYQKLLQSLPRFVHANTEVIMVLTQGCEMNKIFDIASMHGFYFQLLMEKNVFFDGKDFLYRIKPKASA
jgi:release factor glutamine methyltransferase